MNSKENQFDKIIKSKMDNYEVLPDEEFWKTIESNIVCKQHIHALIKVISIVFITTLISFFIYKKYTSPHTKESEELNKTEQVNNPLQLVPSVSQEETEENPLLSTPQSQPISPDKDNLEERYLSKQQILNRTLILDSSANMVTKQDNIEHTSINISRTSDSIKTNVSTSENSVHKKVVKKPVYIIKQDTIYKVDTLKVKKRKSNND